MSTHHCPATFLLAHTVVQADGAPPLTPVPEVSSMLEAPSTVGDTDASLRQSFWTMPSAADGPWSILHCSLPGVNSSTVLGAPAHASSVHHCSDSDAMPNSGCDAHTCSHSAHVSSAHNDPPWDSHEHDGFWSSQTYNQLVEARNHQPYAFGTSWMFWHESPQDPNFLWILAVGLFACGMLTMWTMVWCCVTLSLLHGGFRTKNCISVAFSSGKLMWISGSRFSMLCLLMARIINFCSGTPALSP